MGTEAIEKAPATNGKPVSPSTTVDILLTDIRASPLTPQKHRRERFDQEKLKELAASIAQKGVISPITVRPVKGGYELVAGERRWLASGMAGATTITAVIREISDQDAAEIQLLENLQREDVHPLDEANSYKYLHEKLKIEIAEIALKVGKPEKHVLGRLKLNVLSSAALKMLNAGELPIGHAMELAKYPDITQKFILKECLKPYAWSDHINPLKAFRESIERQVHLKLSKAPFSLKSADLLPSGLKCEDCTERSGANPTLFDDADPKDDRCLNMDCYGKKIDQFIQITRTEVSNTSIRAGDKPEGFEAPLVRPGSYGPDKKYPKSLNYYDAKYFTAKKDICEFAEVGIVVDKERPGQKTYFCRSSKCKQHKFSSSSSSSSGGEKTDEQKEKFRERKEEIWNIKVRESVRRATLKEAAIMFSQTFAVSGKKVDLLPGLVARTWDLCEGDTLVQLVKPLIAEMMTGDRDIYSYKLTDRTANVRDKFTGIEQAQVLFLLIHGAEGAMYANYSYKAQGYIQDLAEEFGINYRLIDAKLRVEFSPKKHLPAHKAYLEAVENGDAKAKIPLLYAAKYVLRDRVEK